MAREATSARVRTARILPMNASPVYQRARADWPDSHRQGTSVYLAVLEARQRRGSYPVLPFGLHTGQTLRARTFARRHIPYAAISPISKELGRPPASGAGGR